MFNLLPVDIKESIAREYSHKRLLVILFFVVCVQATMLVFIFPTWLVSFYKEKEIIAESQKVNNNLNDSNVSPATTEIKSINSRLNVINTSLEYPKLLPFIDTVISKKTNSISINNFSYVPSASSSATLIVGGVSATRESLVSFVKSLEDTELFTKVDLPIGNLAKDKGIEFTISLKI